MTRLMEQAIERLSAVPATQQDEIARFLLAELEADLRWSQSTAKHGTELKSMVDDVLADDARGDCQPLDPDKL